jgi:hypothetical protein
MNGRDTYMHALLYLVRDLLSSAGAPLLYKVSWCFAQVRSQRHVDFVGQTGRIDTPFNNDFQRRPKGEPQGLQGQGQQGKS